MADALITAELERAAALLAHADSVVALTGAGISTESGIPDFRGPQGIWTKDPDAVRFSTLDAYVTDPEVRRRAWQMRRDHPTWTAAPNEGHRALGRLEAAGRLRYVVTQNIDGLHQRAGNDPGRVVELHGTLHEVGCLACGERGPMSDALARVAAGELDPPCRSCGGILKSATISFGQPLDPAVLDRAMRAVTECDVLLVVGTSLTVYPAAHLPGAALRAGARLVIVNEEPTPYDDDAAAVVRGPAGAVLRELSEGVEARGR